MNRKLLSIVSCFLAISLLTAPKTPLQTEPVSAASNQLNLKIYMCDIMCYQFHGNDGHITAGTYGVPASFNKRLPAIMNYVYGYYRNCGIVMNYEFTTANIRRTPAGNCAFSSNSPGTVLANGCSCVTNSQCLNGNRHHNSCYIFKNDIPSFNKNNEGAVYLAATNFCLENGNSHGYANGVTWANDMKIVSGDLDHCKSHGSDTSESYAYAYSRKTLIHEIGHLYSVADHYAVLPDQHPNCIWGKNRNNYYYTRNCVTCEVCHATIIANKTRYQHV